MPEPKALIFDVFGTVVDWRTSVARESIPWLAKLGRSDLDPHVFADGWRSRYIKIMTEFHTSGREFVVLDVLHREMLDDWLSELGIDPSPIGEEGLNAWNLAWHRLDPWPDTVEGMHRLRTKFPLATCSNGNIRLMLDMARHGGLPWDAILGAEISKSYKPSPETYLGSVRALMLEPGEVCLVAAHHGDLAAARKCGLQAAYVYRAMEFGGAPSPDTTPVQDWEYSATTFTELADKMGC